MCTMVKGPKAVAYQEKGTRSLAERSEYSWDIVVCVGPELASKNQTGERHNTLDLRRLALLDMP